MSIVITTWYESEICWLNKTPSACQKQSFLFFFHGCFGTCIRIYKF